MVARVVPILPRPTGGDPLSMKTWADQLCRALELQFNVMQQPGGGQAYTVTNLTPSYSLNAGAATAAQTAEVLGTLIRDLQSVRTID